MTKVYIGIDAHKESNVVALAFSGLGEPELYGKASADLKAFEAVLRRIMKKYELSKEDVALCYERSLSPFSKREALPMVVIFLRKIIYRCAFGENMGLNFFALLTRSNAQIISEGNRAKPGSNFSHMNVCLHFSKLARQF